MKGPGDPSLPHTPYVAASVAPPPKEAAIRISSRSGLGVRERLRQEIHGEPETLLKGHLKAIPRAVVRVTDLLRMLPPGKVPK
jgi:hypothetical protein